MESAPRTLPKAACSHSPAAASFDEAPQKQSHLFESLAFLEDDVPRPPAFQMAVDQALLELTTVPVLRVYQWAFPCVTIGYFESQAAATSIHPGLPVIRRWTGGGVVVHGGDSPYSLIVPQHESFARVRPASAYQMLHGALAQSLSQSLPNVALAAGCAPKQSAACFENPVPNDLLCNGHKIGGAGQRRTRLGLLHQGSLMLGGVRFEAAPLFARLLALDVQKSPLTPEALLLAERLVGTRYGLDTWNADKPRV